MLAVTVYFAAIPFLKSTNDPTTAAAAETTTVRLYEDTGTSAVAESASSIYKEETTVKKEPGTTGKKESGTKESVSYNKEETGSPETEILSTETKKTEEPASTEPESTTKQRETATKQTEKATAKTTNPAYTEYKMPESSGFKCYMSYKSITSRTSPQYKLQAQYAVTGTYGIRQAAGRYCIAVGTVFGAKVGDYADLLLENGTVIPVIISDFKAFSDTVGDGIMSINGCVSEFLVDPAVLDPTAKRMGDISYCEKDWESPVASIRFYKKNIFG